MIGLKYEINLNSEKIKKLLIDEGVKAGIQRASNRIAAEILADAKENTPVRTATLKRGWKISQPPKTEGNVTTTEVANTVEYASYVEEGHKTRNGGFVPGRHMFKTAVNRTHNRVQKIFDAEIKKI